MLVFILLLIVLAINYSNKRKKDVIEYEPIGYISTKYTLKTGAPRQGSLMPESKGIIILDTAYVKGLSFLNEFEYIWVVSNFHKVVGWDNIIIPPNSNHKFGVFSTRSPRRPNPVGLSLVKLDSIVKNKLYVSGVDLFDGTPIIDIKPFLPSVDYVLSEKNMKAEIYLGHHDEDFINDSLVKEFVLGEKMVMKNDSSLNNNK